MLLRWLAWYHFYFKPLSFQALEKRMAEKYAPDEDWQKSLMRFQAA